MAMSYPASQPPAQMQEAFAAIYSSSTAVVRQGQQPGGRSDRGEIALSVTPGLLTRLGPDQYALISLERDDLGAHVDKGALSIAYLKRQGGQWRLQHRWDEFAWSGNTGRPADWLTIIRRAGAPPLVFAVTSDFHQGQGLTTGVAIALADDAPQSLGELTLAGELEVNNGCDVKACGAYAYQGSIETAHSPRVAFTVTYRGWSIAPGGSAPRHRLYRVVTYHIRHGALVGSRAAALPD